MSELTQPPFDTREPKYRVAVYGNLIWDQIVTIDGPLTPGASHNCIDITTAAGGLANFCRASDDFSLTAITTVGHDGLWLTEHLRSMGVSTSIAVSPDPTSKAVVIADRHNRQRTGMVKWGACRNHSRWVPSPHADLHHFMYLDRMRPPPVPTTGLVTGDFCDTESVLTHPFVRYCDYAFASDREERPLSTGPCPSIRRGVVVHSPDRAYVMRPGAGGRVEILDECRFEVVEGLNVVGAGDYFAAYCVAKILTTGKPDLAWAHHRTVELLRKQS